MRRYCRKNNAGKKQAFKVFENQVIYKEALDRGIVITYDDDYYYVYNIRLENPKILEFSRDEVSDIYAYGNSSNEYIYVKYKKTDELNNGVALYMLDGQCLLEKTDINTFSITAEKWLYPTSGSLFTSLYARKYRLTYKVKVNDELISKNIYFYSVAKSSSDNATCTYYMEEEYNKTFNDGIDVKYDGAAFGLDGYEIKVDDKVYIFKGNKLVNSYSADFDIISHGYALFQEKKEVSKNDNYDIFINDSYYKITTYKINLLTSKLSEVKNFHYLLKDNGSTVFEKDNDGNRVKVKGYAYPVYDFKEKKSVTTKDIKIAFVKGNGEIEINKSYSQTNTTALLKDDNYYYSYNATTTVLNDLGGKVVEIYDGTFYDDVTIKTKDNFTTFTDKNGNVVLALKSCKAYALNKYIGTDLSGKKMLAVINSGSINTAIIDDYTITDSNNSFLTKMDEENNVTFYSFDDTLTKIDFGYVKNNNNFTKYTTFEDVTFYKVVNSDGTSTLVYFA